MGRSPVNLSGALALLAHKRQEVVFVAVVSFVSALRWLAGRASARYGRSRSCPGAPHRSDGIVFSVWPSLTAGTQPLHTADCRRADRRSPCGDPSTDPSVP